MVNFTPSKYTFNSVNKNSLQPPFADVKPGKRLLIFCLESTEVTSFPFIDFHSLPHFPNLVAPVTRPKVKAMCTHCLARFKGAPLYLKRQFVHVAFVFWPGVCPPCRSGPRFPIPNPLHSSVHRQISSIILCTIANKDSTAWKSCGEVSSQAYLVRSLPADVMPRKTPSSYMHCKICHKEGFWGFGDHIILLSVIICSYCSTTKKKKKKKNLLNCLVDMQHAPAKLPSKLHLFVCGDVLAQSLCIKAWLNHFGRMVVVRTEASWDFLHVNYRHVEGMVELILAHMGVLKNPPQLHRKSFCFHSGKAMKYYRVVSLKLDLVWIINIFLILMDCACCQSVEENAASDQIDWEARFRRLWSWKLGTPKIKFQASQDPHQNTHITGKSLPASPFACRCRGNLLQVRTWVLSIMDPGKTCKYLLTRLRQKFDQLSIKKKKMEHPRKPPEEVIDEYPFSKKQVNSYNLFSRGLSSIPDDVCTLDPLLRSRDGLISISLTTLFQQYSNSPQEKAEAETEMPVPRTKKIETERNSQSLIPSKTPNTTINKTRKTKSGSYSPQYIMKVVHREKKKEEERKGAFLSVSVRISSIQQSDGSR
ncbi:hypothetical protein VP01_9g2 [Puccinia sorghi]|uniref:Uncharacterized protein n=1 Tax=Puccinia sorghi TaxID=27349 RepID=A0A0L6U544_9BASI|nr:hypothetical protein VP01_9g2 [Puccinia sorghi]